MRVPSLVILLLLAAVVDPLAVTAQGSTNPFSLAAPPFPNVTPRAVSLTPPQSQGEKSVALAVALNAIFPGVGNFYAGNMTSIWAIGPS